MVGDLITLLIPQHCDASGWRLQKYENCGISWGSGLWDRYDTFLMILQDLPYFKMDGPLRCTYNSMSEECKRTMSQPLSILFERRTSICRFFAQWHISLLFLHASIQGWAKKIQTWSRQGNFLHLLSSLSPVLHVLVITLFEFKSLHGKCQLKKSQVIHLHICSICMHHAAVPSMRRSSRTKSWCPTQRFVTTKLTSKSQKIPPNILRPLHFISSKIWNLWFTGKDNWWSWSTRGRDQGSSLRKGSMFTDANRSW